MNWGIDLLDLMEKYGIWGIVVFVIISVLASILKPKLIGDAFLKLFSFFKKKDQSVSESNIINHDIFNYIDFG